MIEKVIPLEDVALVDFLGVDNSNIKELATAFPNSKIIARGSEIRIQGASAEIIKVHKAINELLLHYRKFGKVTVDNILDYVEMNADLQDADIKDEILLYGAKGIAIRPKTSNQQKLVDAVKKNDLVFALGPAGTGKTYVATALAVKALKNKQVKRIIISRPAVEAGESLGFLPGDLKDKVDPYLRPIYDALDDMIPSEKLKFYMENRVIEIAPLAYMRGRTLSNAFVLLDEAQNTTEMQMKMLLTRLGLDSKMIITGDVSQIDLPPRQKSGLVTASRILENVQGIKVLHLSQKDVVRHRLVKNIISAYKKFDDKKKVEKEAIKKDENK
ncbi:MULTISPECIES: PhoH family protein [Flammeovirga]|uniref:PhoH-like protein n=1 Tax=Flammeovirga agarivorans TaxID=2726742 RepID=A0A7X8XXH0_9BACT|nr:MULTISPECIES: PhoH family protein [Flammeovirga]NLR93211.1 PhoH family protein [Flammeovirga agarivorans]